MILAIRALRATIFAFNASIWVRIAAFGFATASFAKRGTAASDIEAVTASFQVYPSMSINKDWVPEYWMNYTTFSCAENITVAAYDENGNIIPSRTNASQYRLSSPLSQSKQLLVSFTYTEPWTSASVSVDKLFTIVPEGKLSITNE